MKFTPVMALALGVSSLALVSPAHAATSDVVAFADTHANARHAVRNHANSAKLRVDGTPGQKKQAFLKFKVPALRSGQVLDRVVLRLTPAKASAQGVKVFSTGRSWGQNTLTWRTRPTGGTFLGASDALRAGKRAVIRLDSKRITPGEVLSVRLGTSAEKQLVFASAEARPAKRPVLSVKTSASTKANPDPRAFPPVGQQEKLIGMSAPAHLWDARVREVGANGLTSRRIFADLSASGSSLLPLIRKTIDDGMMPVISYKVPNPTTMANGGYDSWLATLRTQLNSLGAPVTATFWHEPHGDMAPAVFRAASLKFFNGVDSPSIAVGPILNGWLLDRRVSEFASYTDANLLNKWEFFAVDSYQNGSQSNPGNLMPARAIPLLEKWMNSVGHPDKPLGLGEYNAFTGSAMAEAGEHILSTPEMWFAIAWNSTASGHSPLSGDRITAFKRTKADARAKQ